MLAGPQIHCTPARYADIVCTRARIHASGLTRLVFKPGLATSERDSMLGRTVHGNLQKTMYWIQCRLDNFPVRLLQWPILKTSFSSSISTVLFLFFLSSTPFYGFHTRGVATITRFDRDLFLLATRLTVPGLDIIATMISRTDGTWVQRLDQIIMAILKGSLGAAKLLCNGSMFSRSRWFGC